MIYVNRYKTDKGYIIAMCDEELIGTVIAEGERRIDLKTYASFYKKELLKEEEAENSIKLEEIYSANIVGKRAVNIFIKKGIAKDSNIVNIGKVPTIQIFSIS